jgi:hypothetical protein
MRLTPTPGSIAGRRNDRAGDPLDGLINLFDLSLVLAVGLLLAALSSIGATQLIVPGTSGTPLQGQPPSSGQNAAGPGQEVGKVYRLNDGRYVFAPSAGSSKSGGATAATGATSTTPGATGGATGTVVPGPSSTPLPPASTTPTPATPSPTG